jgi:hypothetical protein
MAINVQMSKADPGVRDRLTGEIAIHGTFRKAGGSAVWPDVGYEKRENLVAIYILNSIVRRQCLQAG